MTDARPIVHVGYHKTATTWFQQAVYPHATSHRYVPRRVVQDALLAPSAFAFDPRAARAALGTGPLVLCEENLSGYIHNGGLNGHLSAAMAERIRMVLPDARIVIFVRAQPAMIAACYAQYVQGGGTHRPHRYLFPADHLHGAAADPWKAARFSFDHFDYDALCRRYRDLFGAEAVHVFPYEELRADREAFLKRFAERLELGLKPARIDRRERNVSYGRGAMTAGRLLNRFTARSAADKRVWLHLPFAYAGRRWLLDRVGRLSGGSASPEEVLGAPMIAWIADRYAASNARLAAESGLDLAAHDYPLAASVRPVPRPEVGRWRRWLAR
jgi:hypothetical protein